MTGDSLGKDTVEKKERVWGMLCHLTALLPLLTAHPALRILLPTFIGPLFVWLMKRKTSPFIDEQGKESLNFQLSMTLYIIITALAFYMIYLIFGMFPMLPIFILAVINLLLVVIAAVRANNGEIYRYPFKIRFIK